MVFGKKKKEPKIQQETEVMETNTGDAEDLDTVALKNRKAELEAQIAELKKAQEAAKNPQSSPQQAQQPQVDPETIAIIEQYDKEYAGVSIPHEGLKIQFATYVEICKLRRDIKAELK